MKFKDQGDTLPPELAKHMENLLSAMTEVEEFEKKGNDMAADSPESLQMLRFDLVEKVEEKLQKCFPEISQHGLQGANLRGSVLPGVNLCGAQLQGASLSETYLLLALMRNANLIGATLAWADMLGSNLQDAKIQGASFEGASLAGAFLMNVRAEKANFSMARMQGAVLGRADLRGANFANADLTNAMLHLANLQGAVLGSSKLRGANLMNADLTDADLCNADLSGAILTGVKWDRAPDCTGMKCDVLEIPRFAKKGQAPNGWLLSSVGSRVLKSFTSGGDDEDSDAEDSEGEEGDEDGARGTEEGDEEGADASGCAAPLLSCGQVQSELVDVSELATEKLADAGRRRVEAALQNLDQRLQPKAQALMKVLENPKMTEMLTEKAMATQGLQESVRKLASLGSSVSGKKFEQAFQKFEGELQKRQLEDGGKALTSWVMSLGDSHFKAHTGYSSSDLLGFLKVSPKQMARDTRELEEIHNYLEKLQENVNKNNWDDIVDNFVCLYNMYQRLKGERSRQVFTQIWQSEELRRAVGVGRAFQEIECRDTPPNFVLRQVKSAVQIVKKLRRLGRVGNLEPLYSVKLYPKVNLSFP